MQPCTECSTLLEHLRFRCAYGWKDPLRRIGQVPWETTLTLQELHQLLQEIDDLTLREESDKCQ